LPEFAVEPAGSPFARTFKAHFGNADSNVADGGVLIFGQMGCLLRCGVILAEAFDDPAPGGFLCSVEFTEMERMSL
jgi:hypothetical protein